mmetsp:Transcript_19589/g.26566  ORF Transcript_19589/g.26566 Transcript_19589/m.26566 type:complete len:224 (+) Transcript_19589:2107-2778(+)
MDANSALGAIAPRPHTPADAALAHMALLMYASFGSTGTRGSSSTAAAAAVGGGVGGAITGGGHMSLPASTTSMPLTASSSWSMTKTPFSLVVWGPADIMNFIWLLLKRDEEVDASRLFMSVYPMHFTPLGVTISWSFIVVSMLPPVSAARSTVTDPGFMTSTMSFVISTGALRPGMRAVPMMISTSSHCFFSIFAAASNHSGDISFAYPPAPAPSSSNSTFRN